MDTNNILIYYISNIRLKIKKQDYPALRNILQL